MKDPMWVTGLRIIHITCGFFAFFIAPVVLAMVKGGKQHRRWGKVYFWMMAVVAATALVLGFYRPIVFLALIAVFSFYMAFVGYRVLYRKQPRKGQGATLLDWTGTILVLAAGVDRHRHSERPPGAATVRAGGAGLGSGRVAPRSGGPGPGPAAG